MQLLSYFIVLTLTLSLTFIYLLTAATMKITFSRKKWSPIFSEIDKNYDDEIAFEELFIFLFPNHDRALAVVRIRLLAQLLACYSQHSTSGKKKVTKVKEKCQRKIDRAP